MFLQEFMDDIRVLLFSLDGLLRNNVFVFFTLMLKFPLTTRLHYIHR